MSCWNLWHSPQYPATTHTLTKGGDTDVNPADAVSSGDSVTPIFVSVKDAARILGISPWSCYQLLDAQHVESRYHGRRRLVLLTSLRRYAENLPNYPAESSA